MASMNVNHLSLVTDASCHGMKDTLVTVFANVDSEVCCHGTAQCISPVKVIAPGQMLLDPSIEEIAASREHVRLSGYNFLQALSHQILQLTQLSMYPLRLDSYIAPLELGLAPLKPGDARRCFVNEHGVRQIVIQRSGRLPDNVVLLESCRDIPVLAYVMDQSTVGMAAAAWVADQSSHTFLCHWAWDKVHRCIRDIKLSMDFQFQQISLMCTYLWSVNYKPFGAGSFHVEKQDIFTSFVSAHTHVSRLSSEVKNLYVIFSTVIVFVIVGLFNCHCLFVN